MCEEISKKNMEKANILSQALPYIQKYTGKTVVIKYGGNAMINEKLKNDVISDIVLLNCVGIKVVVVHGGGPAINDVLKKIGKKSEFIDGLRVTDEETIDVVQMVLCGKVNKDMVSLIGKKGGKAIGLSGLDAGLLKSTRIKSSEGNNLGFVGRVTDVNSSFIEDCLRDGYIPVISTIAADEKDGHAYNINADYAAARISIKLKAEKLMLLTDVPGILKDVNDSDSLISDIKVNDIKSLKESGIIKGGMLPKVDCCIAAVNGGVSRAHIIDGRISHSILLEIFSDEGVGTMIY